ncbi:unnamed protein product, partial [Protopolystoma xenopodis]
MKGGTESSAILVTIYSSIGPLIRHIPASSTATACQRGNLIVTVLSRYQLPSSTIWSEIFVGEEPNWSDLPQARSRFVLSDTMRTGSCHQPSGTSGGSINCLQGGVPNNAASVKLSSQLESQHHHLLGKSGPASVKHSSHRQLQLQQAQISHHHPQAGSQV